MHPIRLRALVFVLVGLALVLATSSAFAQDNAALAQLRFARGTQLYTAQQYEAALTEFRAAQALYASPNSRFYIARCLRDLGRVAEAVPELELALQEAEERARSDPRYRATRDAARRLLNQLAPQVARVTLNAARLPPAARLQLNEREYPVEALGVPLPVMPGRLRVRVEAPGYQAFVREADVAAGQQLTVEVPSLELQAAAPPPVTTPAPAPAAPTPPPRAAPVAPVEPPPRPDDRGTGNGVRALGGVLIGVGALGLASFGVFGTLTLLRFNQLTADCNPTPCPAGQRASVLEGQTFQLFANVSLPIGIAGAVVGTILVIAAPRAPAPVRSMRAGASPAGVWVGGVF